MRKKIVAGNWKMNLDFDSARSLFHKLSRLDFDQHLVEMMVAPPAIYISQFAFANSSQLLVAGQNCHHEDKGAFTGEWSASMLSSIPVSHCLVGHSERRTLFQEDNAVVAQKVRACFDAGIVPVLCCGETLEQRETRVHFDLISSQIQLALDKLGEKEAEKLIVAYEPVWAIGTGVTASSDQAQEMHAFIRKTVGLHFGQEVANKVRILYGGSVKPGNAGELFSQADVDGGLVGGASLEYESFKAILEAAQ